MESTASGRYNLLFGIRTLTMSRCVPSLAAAHLVLVRSMIRALCFICATLISFAGGTGVQPNSATEDGRPVITGEQLVKPAVFTPHGQYPRAALERNVTGSGSFILHIRVQTGLVRYV